MKKHFYLFAMVLAFTTINTSAKADGLIGDLLNGLLGGGSTPPAGGGQSTPLPINNGVVFLVIAAVVIGFFAIKRSKLGSIPASKG